MLKLGKATVMRNRFATTKQNSFAYFLLLIVLIAIPDFYFFISSLQFLIAIINVVSISSFFLLLIYFFRNNLRLYAWLLLPLIILLPFNLACIIFYNVPVNDSIILLIVNKIHLLLISQNFKV